MRSILAGHVKNFVPVFYAAIENKKVVLGQVGDLVLTVDTGFSDYLALPVQIIEKLNLEYKAYEIFIMANGAPIEVKTYKGEIVVNDKIIKTLFIEGDCLIGMRLLSEIGTMLMVDFYKQKVKLI